MHNTNNLRFTMAVHLLQRSNPATCQGVQRTTGHRASTRRQLERAGRGPTSASFARFVVRSGVSCRLQRSGRLAALECGEALSGAFGLVVEFAVAAFG